MIIAFLLCFIPVCVMVFVDPCLQDGERVIKTNKQTNKQTNSKNSKAAAIFTICTVQLIVSIIKSPQ